MSKFIVLTDKHKLTENSPQLHLDWLVIALGRAIDNYGSIYQFAFMNAIPYLDAVHFFRCDKVRQASFEAICAQLGLDWLQVQQSRAML
ncbi:MAG TPA: hypothetical protein V6D25_14355 [Leptolyngbyaceae cyanobacterium]